MTPEESEQSAFATAIGTVLFRNYLNLIFEIGLFANLVFVKFGLMVPLSGGLIAQIEASDSKVMVLDIFNIWSQDLTFLIADIAIAWRAWALWAENRLIRWTLLVILLADIGISIAYSIVDTKAAANLTLLIMTHYQSTLTISRNKKTQVQTILLLLVRSSAICGVVQVANIIFNALNSSAAVFLSVEEAAPFITSLYSYSAALNPAALVILVQIQNTYGLVSYKQTTTQS
ncbi:hypothetical protein BT96DRAFT_947721 [Gymnopus androsaceus JB14]|uniref:Uncharacterized protein n=1 Tax=Gymnopus androsaceus JB14 TaxID=1447944 RepID=A0A6A4GT17_9AGAR|nr:hypothetical protein BT96DRAFT_947721 [Gymnopus androsaceus JB14]